VTWTFRTAALEAAVAAARAARPAECCGLIIGSGDTVLQTVAARNLATDPNRFLIDPQDHIAARRDARNRGLEVLGFYHSHPHGAATPSARDVAELTYPHHLYLIVGLIEDVADVRLFRATAGNFLEVPFVTVP
jgi:proteasome lid subunit RPN8/RPN11